MYIIHSCPCDYWFSLLLITKYHLKGPKKHLKGIHFSLYDIMKANVPWWLHTRSPHFFFMQTECRVLVEQIYQLIWWLCTEIEGLSNISCCFGFLLWSNKYMGYDPLCRYLLTVCVCTHFSSVWEIKHQVLQWLHDREVTFVHMFHFQNCGVTVDIVFPPENCEMDFILSCSYLCTNIIMSHEKLNILHIFINTTLLALCHCDMFQPSMGHLQRVWQTICLYF